MSKRNIIVGGTGLTSLALIAIMGTKASVIGLAEEVEHEQEMKQFIESTASERPIINSSDEIHSIQLSPGMYIPESSEFLNQEVEWEDVYKTINMESVKLATSSALAEIDAGVEDHLARSSEELNSVQLEFYEASIARYSEMVQQAGIDALDEQDVLDTLNEFKEWVATYKEALDEAFAEIALKESQEEEAVKEVISVDKSPLETKTSINSVSFGIPNLGDQYLTYMPYTAITAKTTPHYRLQQIAKTDSNGYRTHEDAICIALASSYGTTIGTLYDITFADGKVMRAILGDNKSDKHTDELKQYRDATGAYDGKSGNILEIIFDTTNYPDMNSVNRKINGDYSAKIVSIVKVGMAEGFGL